jgi:hypothetical protein
MTAFFRDRRQIGVIGPAGSLKRRPRCSSRHSLVNTLKPMLGGRMHQPRSQKASTLELSPTWGTFATSPALPAGRSAVTKMAHARFRTPIIQQVRS